MVATVKRVGWGALDAKAVHSMRLPVNALVVGFTLTYPCQGIDECSSVIKVIQERNMFRYNLPDIRYNFLIDAEGNIYICRGWRIIPSLPKRLRYLLGKSIYIGLLGFPTDDVYDPVKEAKEDIVMHGIQNRFLTRKYLEFNI